MDIIQLIPLIYDKLIIFILVFTRISSLLTTFVLFRRDLITSRMIISLSFITSSYVLLMNTNTQITNDFFSIPMLTQLLFQGLIGLVSGLILNIVFEIFITIGQIISTQVGLSIASLVDPRFGFITSLTHFYMITATLLFLFLNGHLIAIKTIVESFDVIPLTQTYLPDNLISHVLTYASIMFSGAVMLAMTIVTVLLLTNMALAIMTKFAPQFNLFSIGINMELIIGLFCVYLTYRLFIGNGSQLIQECLKFFQQSLLTLR